MPLLFAVALLAHILGLLAFSKPGLAESTHVRQTDGVETTIVFVHGVIGNAQDTWKNGNFYWPSMLAADQDFKDANIFIYEYPTSFWSSMSIDELAENMRLNLDAYSVTQQKRIIFLAHSMGGLVTRAYLLRNRDIAAKTTLTYFFSTPTAGSQVAAIATILSNNPQLGKMRPINADDYLADVLRQWLAADLKIPSYCAYEKQRTYGMEVVTFQSAATLCNRALDPIDANHLDIARPINTKALSYLAFKSAFKRELKVVPQTSQPSSGHAQLEYQVCQGEHARRCPAGAVHLPCGGHSVQQWAATACRDFQLAVLSSFAGNRCGYTIARVVCTQSK